MTKTEFIAKLDYQLRPFILLTSPWLSTFVYSYGRKYFLNLLSSEIPKNAFIPPPELKRTLWDIEFQLPLFNAAGMFKKAEGYYTVAAQGAGAYLAGTATYSSRKGNIKNGIFHPVLPYHSSGAASNWMGLPNEGFEVLAKRISKIEKVKGCPVGISLSYIPDTENESALKQVIDGMFLFDKAKVDFIELNESCPNIKHNGIENHMEENKNLLLRLELIAEKYLSKRKRNLPVIIKFSNDTSVEQIPDLLDKIIELGFDGINFGNTSTDYSLFESEIDRNDIKNFQYFMKNFNGGLSGKLLKKTSLELSSTAVKIIKNKNLHNEFHVIRTGGIEYEQDINDSNNSGVSLNQWFTGYFSAFATYGHNLYRKLFL